MYYTRGYGEDRDFEMNRLDMFSWVTAGVKKVRAVSFCLDVFNFNFNFWGG